MTQAVQIRHLIGGEAVGEPETERRNPFDDCPVAGVASGDAALVERAVAAAANAQRDWAAVPGPARGAVLLDAAEILRGRHRQVATDLVREEGKTLAEAMGEVRRAIDVLRFFGSLGWRSTGEVLPSGTPSTMVYTRREPLGVIGLNRPTTGLDLNVPFGGVKQSSTNTFREQGAGAMDFYSWTKSVYLGYDL